VVLIAKTYLKVLLPLLAVSTLLIVLRARPWFYFPFITLGFTLGVLIPDIDHLIYWLIRAPAQAVSQQAALFWNQRQFKNLYDLIQTHGPTHDNLIFHHFFGHTVITILSFFIFSSTSNLFVQSLTLAINLHLFLDVYEDWVRRPAHLQSWLFAREPKQLPLTHLKYYVLIFFTCNLLYLGLFLLNL
jgi:hypothetical protein